MYESVIRNFATVRGFSFQNNLKNLDPSYKMDLDFWDCFGRENLCFITKELRYLCYTHIFQIFRQEEGQHKFASMHFQSGTRCDFCGKKVSVNSYYI